MKKHRLYTPFILCLFVIAGGAIFAACTAVSAMQPAPVSQSGEIETAVAATLMQYLIETKVAAEATQLFGAQAAQPTDTPPSPAATNTPLPTEPPTAVPTEVPLPTVIPTAVPPARPSILADANTNCRRGPGTRYIIDAVFAEGSQSVVHGRDKGWDWWYIERPNSPGDFCWVWDGSTIVQGDASNVPVVEAPAASTYTYSSYNYENYVYGPYSGYIPYPCGVFIDGIKMPKCPPKVKACPPFYWWQCSYVCYCECAPIWTNTWKKAGCPPITSVNIKTYCDKYPKCCKE